MQIIEEYDNRFGEATEAAETMEEFVETVQQLPPPPNQMQSEQGTAADETEAPDGEKDRGCRIDYVGHTRNLPGKVFCFFAKALQILVYVDMVF